MVLQPGRVTRPPCPSLTAKSFALSSVRIARSRENFPGATGVRPSSAAARSNGPDVFESIQAPATFFIAAPGDGRTPVRLPLRRAVGITVRIVPSADTPSSPISHSVFRPSAGVAEGSVPFEVFEAAPYVPAVNCSHGTASTGRSAGGAARRRGWPRGIVQGSEPRAAAAVRNRMAYGRFITSAAAAVAI